MRAVIQRVSRAEVRVEGEIKGRIARGLLVLLGVAQSDTEAEADWMARKILGLRIFSDPAGKMNLNLAQAGGALLAVSQFTLLADLRKGHRPAFTGAMQPQGAEALYRRFCEGAEALGAEVARGVFGAHMEVELLNDGPVTLVLESLSRG